MYHLLFFMVALAALPIVIFAGESMYTLSAYGVTTIILAILTRELLLNRRGEIQKPGLRRFFLNDSYNLLFPMVGGISGALFIVWIRLGLVVFFAEKGDSRVGGYFICFGTWNAISIMFLFSLLYAFRSLPRSMNISAFRMMNLESFLIEVIGIMVVAGECIYLWGGGM